MIAIDGGEHGKLGGSHGGLGKVRKLCGIDVIGNWFWHGGFVDSGLNLDGSDRIIPELFFWGRMRGILL